MDNYWPVVKKAQGKIVVLRDEAANILKRITFYNEDSKPIDKHLTETEKPFYLKEIQQDIIYFNPSYKRADISVQISELDPDQAAKKVKQILDKHYSLG